MEKKLKLKLFLFLFVVLLFSGLIFIKLNSYKFYSKYFDKKWQLTKNKIERENESVIKDQQKGIIFLENDKYNFLKFKLEDNGLTYSEDYSYRPIGYIDLYEDRILFAAHDGSFYLSNKLGEIKKGKFKLDKINETNFNFRFDFDDWLSYRNILIRDILVDNKDLYVVINGSNKIKEEEYSLSTMVLKGSLDLENNEIKFEKFFDPNELIIGSTDFSHSGGRIVKYKNNDFLLTVSDHALMDNYKKFIKKINSKDSVIGKIIKLNQDEFEIFSYGHRNPQGLFYDMEKDLIFETEHGPTGGDEINLIKKGNHYGWPIASYGARIDGLNMVRNHKKNGYSEPLKYWWPVNCGISEITKVDDKFNKKWTNYTLLNACLSGSGANQGYSIYRWEYDLKKEKLTKKNQYHIGDRIRDLKYSSKFKTVLLMLEDQKSIGLIFK